MLLFLFKDTGIEVRSVQYFSDSVYIVKNQAVTQAYYEFTASIMKLNFQLPLDMATQYSQANN